ncbi:phosphorylase family protein [Agrobacterium cavarae]|uniref:phosphorylase family protein n=1 Tax=Agrobacterium cavarae TaxID=2528239 RepID=UPI003FD05065
MRILLVEDSPEKIEAIVKIITEISSKSVIEPTVVRTMSEAVKTTSLLQFELVILDLMIPYMPGSPPSSDAGYELLREMRKSGPNQYTKVVSISAFPNEVLEYREKFDKLAVVITAFDDDGSWISTLKAIVSELDGGNQSPRTIDFLIVCALDEEREGYNLTNLSPVSDSSVLGLNIRFMRSDECGIGAILRLSSMGLVAATYEVSRALQAFSTRIVAMSGICAGFTGKVSMGQLVCASLSWEYQAGKWSTGGFEIAPIQVPMPAGTRAIIDNYFDDPTLLSRIEAGIGRMAALPAELSKPKIVPMATGSAVIADESRLQHIKAQHRQVAALDMETFGVYYAAHQQVPQIPHYFSIKTVVDLADSGKSDNLHAYGSSVSAHVVVDLIKLLRKSI